MDISVIIVNWNTRDLILACIQSVLENEKDFSKEVIVVDNGSPNNSMEYIKAWAEGRQEVLTLIL